MHDRAAAAIWARIAEQIFDNWKTRAQCALPERFREIADGSKDRKILSGGGDALDTLTL